MNLPPGNPDTLDRSVGGSAFGIDPNGYHDARSGYPDELFADLARLATPNPRILEIGAGTGLATQGLLTLAPRQLTLIEPDPRLCNFLQSRLSPSGSDVVCGTFPDTVVAGQFDLIACAAAFHWMDPLPALAQVRRMLAPSGAWAMWWNCYFGHGEPDSFGDRVSQILEAHEVSLPPSYAGRRHYALDVEHHVDQLEKCGFHGVTHRVFRVQRQLDARQAAALYQSFSFIRLLPEARQTGILDQIGILVENDFAGLAPSTVLTSSFSAMR